MEIIVITYIEGIIFMVSRSGYTQGKFVQIFMKVKKSFWFSQKLLIVALILYILIT